MSKLQTANRNLFTEITEALKKLDGWGSVEIFVQDNHVVQITARNIRKTKYQITKIASS